jgi:hypothetical protein
MQVITTNNKNSSWNFSTHFSAWVHRICILWHLCWKPELWSQQRQLLLGNSSANMPVVRQWLKSRHMIAAIDTYAIMKETFSVRSMPGLYNEDQLSLWEGVLRWQLEEYDSGTRWLPACKDLSMGAEDHPLLEDVTKQHSEGGDWEHKFVW